jgi:four helix bundle protein
MEKSILKEKSFAFAIRCIKLCRYLTEAKKEYVIINQLLRSGTSVSANIREAQNAESANDFIHKLGIAQKECDETMHWLELLYAVGDLEQKMFDSMHKDASEILKMIKSSILTKKRNAGKRSSLISHNS